MKKGRIPAPGRDNGAYSGGRCQRPTGRMAGRYRPVRSGHRKALEAGRATRSGQSFNLDVACLDHACPFVDFGLLERAEFGGCHAGRFDALGHEF